MIDRSYLPFQSAREYRDSKMQKWMGFFLSEHTTALGDDAVKIAFSRELTVQEIYFLLGQAYANQHSIYMTLKHNKSILNLVGQVHQLTGEKVLMKTNQGFETIGISDILQIKIWEVEDNESA